MNYKIQEVLKEQLIFQEVCLKYKNIRLLKKYMSENGKILPSRITNVSQKKQRELSLSIKRARNLALL